MRPVPIRRLRAFLLPLPLLAGCGDAGSARVAALQRDSAGISIVENRSPDAAPVYSVIGPALEIGHVAGAEEYELHDVNSVVRLSDGSVAVAIGGTEIRWFDAQGRLRHRTGRDGGGPGEFRRIRYMQRIAGDSLLVFDSGNRRVSVLAPDGGYVRGQSIGVSDERPVTVAGALRDGTLLLRTVLETPTTSTPLYRPRIGFTVMRDGAAFPLPPYPGPEASLHAGENGGDVASVFISVLPFARSAYATAGPSLFFVGSSDSYRIDVWNDAGQLVRIVRADVIVQPVTDAVRQDYVSRELERTRLTAVERGQPFDEAHARRQLSQQAHAPAVPAYGGLLATADGGLWVKQFTLPGAAPAPERWTIFDDQGRLAAAIDLPPRFTPLHVEGASVLGVFRDTLDVPYVHGYTFR